ncbi:MAG: hypothetical protein LWX56_11180 [Ignavibacteria bacterium]|nr:hypothetical protein [Ignavibacteria bacterium]
MKKMQMTTSSGKQIESDGGKSGINSAVKGGMQNPYVNDCQPGGETVGMGAAVMVNDKKSYSTEKGSMDNSAVDYHELKENQIMVEEGLPRYNEPGADSAHKEAGSAGVNRANVDGTSANGADGGTAENPVKVSED